jgi:hypothetical protein
VISSSANKQLYDTWLINILTLNFHCSKSGRPMIKKISERKGNTRPRHISSSIQSVSPGALSLSSSVMILVLFAITIFHTIELALFVFQCNLKMIMRSFLLQLMLLYVWILLVKFCDFYFPPLGAI